MKKLNLLSLFVLVIGLTFILNNCKTNENNGNNKNDTTNQINNSNQKETIVQNYTLPKELKYSNHSGNFLYDKLYPIGWSKQGKFAYLIEPADEARGEFLVYLEIKNLVNDKIELVWPKEDTPFKDLKTAWDSNYEILKKYLNDHEIIQQEKIQLEPTKFNYKGNDYIIKLDNKLEQNIDYGFDVIKGTKISLESPQLGKKTVFDYSSKEYSLILGQIIAGHIKSPYEDRIAIILHSERCGYEGPPNVISFLLSGSNLTESFQPDKTPNN